MRVFHTSVLSALLLMAMVILPSPGWADDTSAEWMEARAVFLEMSQSDNPYLARMAQENLKKLERPSKRVEVKFRRVHSKNLAVPALLNQSVATTFIVDTGASYTVVTPRVAEKAGVNLSLDYPRVRIRTANGVVYAKKVVLPSVNIGGLEVENVEAIVHPLGNDILLGGLLGMSFFKHMEVSIRGDRMVLTMEEPLTAASAQ